MIVICWEHHVIPAFAYALGVKPQPQKWPGKVFDRVYIIQYQKNSVASFKIVPQRLLYGDSKN